jgi:hypothetical protein
MSVCIKVGNRNFCLCLLVYCTIFLEISANTTPLTDRKTSYPLLRYTNTDENVVDWSDAVGVATLTGCSLVRITRRGIRCVPSTWTHHSTWTWVSNNCTVSNSALCVLQSVHGGVTYESLVFPESASLASIHETEHATLDLYSPDKEPTETTTTTAEEHMYISDILRDQPCEHGARRTVLAGPGRRYDITACDLFDSNVDILYVPSTSALFIRVLGMENVIYGITSVLILVLIVFIAEELAQEVTKKRDTETPPTRGRMLLMIGTWCALLIMSCILQFSPDKGYALVTEEDEYNLTAIGVYIIMYTVLWVVEMVMTIVRHNTYTFIRTGHSRNHGINAMLATTYFAIQVLTGSSENIYSEPFFFVFMYRMMYKTYGIMRSKHDSSAYAILDRGILTVDIIFFTIFFEYSFAPGFTHYIDAIFRACTFFTIANSMATVISTDEDSPPIVDTATPIKPPAAAAPAAAAAPPPAPDTVAAGVAVPPGTVLRPIITTKILMR